MNSAMNGYKGLAMYLIKCEKCALKKPQYHFKNPNVYKYQVIAGWKAYNIGTGSGVCKPCEAKK